MQKVKHDNAHKIGKLEQKYMCENAQKCIKKSKNYDVVICNNGQ